MEKRLGLAIPYWIPGYFDRDTFSDDVFGNSTHGQQMVVRYGDIRFPGNRQVDGKPYITHVGQDRLEKGQLKHKKFRKKGKVEDALLEAFEELSGELRGSFHLPFAAYDPLFLSYAAYLDSEWAKSQSEPSYALSIEAPFKDDKFNALYKLLQTSACIQYE